MIYSSILLSDKYYYVFAHIYYDLYNFFNHFVRATTLVSSLGCGNLAPTPPHTALSETFMCTSRLLLKGLVVGGFFGCVIKSKPRSGPLKLTNGSVAGTRIILREILCCGILHRMSCKID